MKLHTISFKYAFKGIWTALTSQLNLRIHFFGASLVFILAVIIHISFIEALVLILTIATVIVAEMINTAIEFLADAVTLEQNKLIGQVKDVSAGAVLFSAIFALVIGGLIFIPKLL